ncbi:hypothetical protein ACWHA3_04060 [Streptomyces cyaneofuscatus]
MRGLGGDIGRAGDRGAARGRQERRVGVTDAVGCEQLEHPAGVAGPGRGQEGAHDLRVRPARRTGPLRRLLGGAEASAGPAGVLPGTGHRPAQPLAFPGGFLLLAVAATVFFATGP